MGNTHFKEFITMSGYRKERLEKMILMIIGDSLLKDVKDPRIGFVTVTDVELNKDKSVATVLVSIMGDDKTKQKTMTGLNSAKGYLQHAIGKNIQMRNTPKIRFLIDTSIEEGSEMVNILNNLEEERKDKEEEED